MNSSQFLLNGDRHFFKNEYYHLEINKGVGIVEYTPGLKICYEDAQKIVAYRLKHLGELSYPVLVRSARVHLDMKARKYLFNEGMKNFRAMAFLESSPLEKMLTNAFLKLQPIAVPCRTFSREDAALEWLARFL